MITILEGPDACGKTTLAQSAAFGDHIYRHQGRYQESVVLETLTSLREAREAAEGRPILFDRLHVGEHVYGPIMRGTDMLEPWEDRWLQRVLLSEQAAVILALPNVKTAVRTWQQTRLERDEYVDLQERYLKIFVSFCEIDSGLPQVRYDWERHTFDEVRRQADLIRPPLNRGPGIGHFRPGVTLMVGEQVNLATPPILHPYPFVGSGSGRYLAQQLDILGVPESDLYWVNAIRPDGQVEDPAFIEDLQPSRIIAMGKTAQGWGEDCGIREFHKIPHPQFWRRAHHHKPFVPLQEALCF